MFNHFKRICDEFNIFNYLNNDKITKFKEKKISFNVLNDYEKQYIDYGKAIFMLSYSTQQEKLISYYIIEFNSEQIMDILKINLLNVEDGYVFHSIKSMNSDSLNEQIYSDIILKIIDKDSEIWEFSEFIYQEHNDIAYLIDPKRNKEHYLNRKSG